MPSRDQLLAEARAHHGAGRLSQAEALYRQILAPDPRDVEALAGLGLLANRLHRSDDAIALLTQAIQIEPSAWLYRSRADVLRGITRLDEAIADYEQALRLEPDSIDILINFGVAAARRGDNERAIQLWQKALQVDPNAADAHVNLANVFKNQGKLGAAAESCNKALALDASHAEVRSNLGNILSLQGRIDDAIAAHRRAVTLKPSSARIHSNLLLNLHYSDRVSPQEVFDEHLLWSKRHADPLTASALPPTSLDRNPEKRLRIGYVSPDFREHPIAHFIEPLLAHHGRNALEVYCFADVYRRDAVTGRLQALAGHWIETTGRSDEQLAQLVREHRIDVLVDLSVHTSGHRLLTFARRPAPVQVTWLGYAATTGMRAMDWRLTDACVDPPGMTETWHSEKLYRLPESFWCYQPLQGSPPVGDLPASRNRHITFGSFNKLNKITPTVIGLWIRILERLPDARLIIKSAGLDDPPTRQRLLDAFAGRADRVRLVGWSDLRDYLALFDEVDVGLDSYPFNGGTTSCHALWMGVPLVSLAGPVPVARVGTSLLTNLGLGEWIANSPNEYVEKAVGCASNITGLTQLRRGLRERMQASPLMDGPRVAKNVESAYRSMWRDYLESSG